MIASASAAPPTWVAGMKSRMRGDQIHEPDARCAMNLSWPASEPIGQDRKQPDAAFIHRDLNTQIIEKL